MTAVRILRPSEPTLAVRARDWASADDRRMIEATVSALDLIAAKWKVDVICLLAVGVRRYSRLHDHLRISKKVLTDCLRELERDGLVRRDVVSDRPRHVEYALTQLGWSLTAPLLALCEWAEEHAELVAEARTAAGVSVEHGDDTRFTTAFRLRR
jgi:DNA-binding HxlR family transcriptional regulator